MDADARAREDFAGAVQMLRRQRWVILATTAVVGLAALASVLVASPVYLSGADVAVEPVRWRAEDVVVDAQLTPQELTTQQRIATSEAVTARVAEDLDDDLDAAQLLARVSAQAVDQTRIIRITARDGDAERAARIASAYASAYVAHRQQDIDQQLERAIANLRARRGEVRERIASLEQELAATEQGPGRAALAREREALLGQLGEVATQLATLAAARPVDEPGGVVLRSAQVPSAALSPQPLQRIALGLVVGLLLSLAVAWVREHREELFSPPTTSDASSPGA